ncbi:MAG: ATP-binding cassette domain-containing protein, partial [Holophagaceae bacterium]
MPMIKLHNVSKAFDQNKVLDRISLEVEESESLVILGGSGTGKTVLLKVILGLLRPNDGNIFVDGARVNIDQPTALFEIRKKIGMCFQMAALFDSM